MPVIAIGLSNFPTSSIILNLSMHEMFLLSTSFSFMHTVIEIRNGKIGSVYV